MLKEVCHAIGNTPLIKINDGLYAKLEGVNPSGSIKDRMAKAIIEDAIKSGVLKKGGLIIEATSGNTGISLSMLAAAEGYQMIVVMPSNMSEERKDIIKYFGADIVEVAPGDFCAAVAKRNELVERYNAFNPNQFESPINVACHKLTTGREIIRQVRRIDRGHKGIAAFIAGTGTGGTLMGVGEALKELDINTKIIAVEPKESAVMSGHIAGPHVIQGIGDGFIPPIIKLEKLDGVITVAGKEAIDRAKSLAKELGLLVGISSGANVLAAEAYIKKNNPDGLVITVLPDNRDRYCSILV